MKKIVIALFFFWGFQQLGLAQEGDLRFGFQLSPSFSWMNTNDTRINRSGTNLGMKLGMLAEYYFRENYAFSTGIGFAFNHGGTLLFEYGGSYWKNSNLGSSLDTLPDGVKLKYNLQFVEIPATIKMRTREFGYLRYFLEPGITIGLRSQARGSITGRGIGDQADKFDIRRDVNGLNLAWGMGGGVEYSLTETTSLVAGLGFQVGFADITEDKGTVFDPDRGNQLENSKGKVSALTLKLGLMF
ncbi:MAG: outer membrane beta-barrel protein [Haliscomenobacter sp.]|nr:outer membrane beta-barrel protein [Haliscomenobacter sp.]MBK8655298.1 outer membrane beta-barrel protein [Haliscomenobacter sp.]MBP9076080.1 outer membrane beta-barrel protein [Haliscomenobacter sp.]MBP9873847.1 outer membrane beta-barrel protein [Haliscomenobacter sp.]